MYLAHSSSSFEDAIAICDKVPNVFGLVYKDEKPMYDQLVLDATKLQKKKNLESLLDDYVI